MLKPVSKALEDGDNILAVIKGSAINQDGHSNGLTAPNGISQQDVINAAIDTANLKPEDIDYIETHGTGTALGDPIEIQALDTVYNENRDKNKPLILGSVKSNIGHLESAAGIAGLIKTVLCIQNSSIPKQIHFDTPNKHINWKNLNIKIPQQYTGWNKENNEPKRAGISSFGFGGANAHIILEEFLTESKNNREINVAPRTSELVTISGKSAKALEAQISNLVTYLKENEAVDLQDVSYSLGVARDHFGNRLGIVAESKEDLLIKLDAVKVQENTQATSPKTAFVFTGQGSQYIGMGKILYASEPIFRYSLDQCAEILKPLLEKDLLTIMFAEEGSENEKLIDQTMYTQPAIFSIGYALYQLWSSWGVTPEILLGHSIGEITAACVAGVLSLEDSLKLVASRGRLMQELCEKGSMVAVQSTAVAVSAYIDKYKDEISIAAINGPNQTVISGNEKTLKKICDDFSFKGIKHKPLTVSHAFHSPMMKPMLDEFKKVAESLTYKPSIHKIVSTVTGDVIKDELSTAQYWIDHVSAPVHFYDGILTLESLDVQRYVEIGAHPILTVMGSQCLEDDHDAIWIPSLKKNNDEIQQMLQGLAEWYECGGIVDWVNFYKNRNASKVGLPTYAFQHKKYWLDPVQSDEVKVENTVVLTKEETPETTSIKNIINDIEEKIKNIISGSLQIDVAEISHDTTLLELGADSIVLLECTKKIEKEFNIKIPIRRLFEDLTDLKSLISYVEENSPIIAEQVENDKQEKNKRSSLEQVKINGVSKTNSEANTDVLQIIREQFAEQNRILSQYLQISDSGENLQNLEGLQINGVSGLKSSGGKTKEKVILPSSFGDKDFFFTKLPDNQEQQLPGLIEAYTKKTPNSKLYANRNKKVLSDYRSTLGFRMSTKEMVYPIVTATAAGSRFTDIDDNEYIDITMGMGSCIFGHQPDFIVEAIQNQLQKGINIGPLAELSGEVANLISEITGMERVCFANTGSEAVSFALRLARSVTGKNKIVIFSGSYHGHSELILGVAGDSETDIEPMVSGIPKNMVQDLIVLNYSDDDILDQIRAHADDLAGVMIEPVRSRYPGYQPIELIKELRALTKELDVPFIFDEMITGFRIMPGGAQEYFGIRADIATYGKIVGGGMPIGVIAGSSKYLDAVDGGNWNYGDDSYPEASKTLIAGTFTRHPLAMAASKAVLLKIKEIGVEAYQQLNQKTADLIERLNQYFKKESLPIEMHHFGSLFCFKYKGNFDLLLFRLIEKGIYAWAANNLFLSFAHDEKDVEEIYEAICECVLTVHRLDGTGSGNIDHENILPSGKSHESTLAQRQLFLLDEINKEQSLGYILSFSIDMKGKVNLQYLEKALDSLLDNHEILRSKFSEDGEFLIYDDSITIPLHQIDISDVADENKVEKYQLLIKEELDQPFSFTEGPLIRLNLVKLDQEQHVLLVSLHHIMSDGWSCALFIEELTDAYKAISKGEIPNKAVEVQFSDYVNWLNEYKASQRWKEDETYFNTLFSDKKLKIDLPFHRDTKANENQSDFVKCVISSEELNNYKQWSNKHGLTLFMTFLSAFELLLFKLSQSKDIVLGIPVGGRGMSNIEKSIGYFSHIMPLTSHYDPEESVTAYVKDLRRRLFDAFDHQDYPYGYFIDLHRQEGQKLYEGMNVYFNFDVGVKPIEIEELTLSLEEHRTLYTDIDLMLNTIENDDELIMSLDFRSSLLSKSLAEQILACFKYVVDQITTDENTYLSEVKVISEKDQKQLLTNWDAVKYPIPSNTSVLTLFEDQVSANPNHIALRFEDQVISYKELDERSNQLAHYLIKKGVQKEELVPICIERSVEMIVGILGILKSGAAYVPISTKDSKARALHILSDTNSKLVLSDTTNRSFIEGAENLDIVLLDKDFEQISKEPIAKCDVVIDTNQLAYIIYTSGSTGLPKGVMIEHHAVLNHIVYHKDQFGIDSTDTILLFSNYAFDASVEQMFLALTSGSALIIPKEDILLDVDAFQKFIKQEEITHLHATPSFLINLPFDGGYTALRRVIAGGESCPLSLAKLWGSTYEFYNEYGPTETTITSIAYKFDPTIEEDDILPIGKPIGNTQVYILGDSLEVLPVGVVGELCLGGSGLARGYLNREELTSEKFIAHPFKEGERIYKTGDLARWLPDGSIAFVGRKDDQVKIRGYRIELGEIESVLHDVSGVVQGVVQVTTDAQGVKRLVGYVVVEADLDREGIISGLSERLPDYMIPQLWVLLDSLPLNRNGKVDKKSLPSVDVSELQGVEYVAPQTATEGAVIPVLVRAIRSRKSRYRG